MKAKVKPDAYRIYMKKFAVGTAIPNRDFADALKRIEGTELEVSTDHLFNGSVNAYYKVEGGDISVIGLGHEYISEIFGDVRTGKGKCRWCGDVSEGFPDCGKCGHAGTMERFKAFRADSDGKPSK